MGSSLPILENARIASPCDMSWNAMRGDERTRFCKSCDKHVYNLVGMSDDDIADLIRQKEGRLCVRLYQRHDGTLMASDCPVGLRAARRRLARALGAVAACLSLILTAVTFGRIGAWRLRDTQPFSRIANWLAPPAPQMLTGEVCVPPPPRPTAILGKLGPAKNGGV